MISLRAWAVCVVGLAGLAPASAADPFDFRDGDRVVLIGSTLIEREQKYGDWELALTLKNRDKNVTFRNLGWSGDTVWGEARNGFDPSPKGYERLVKVTKEMKPTVIVICYGHNESFEGTEGLAKFTTQYEKLLDDLAVTKARIVLMTPTPFEPVGSIANPQRVNENLRRYCEAILALATKRMLSVVDLFQKRMLHVTFGDPSGYTPLTGNGIHLTPEGYQYTARTFFRKDSTAAAERLQRKIAEKNQLVFHQWRPQNETYLFLFRKHEQGQNAKDIPAFDPLIAKAEAEIQELKKSIQ